MIERFLILGYGGIVISSIFMFWRFSHIAYCEVKDHGWRSPPVRVAVLLCFVSLGLAGLAWIRAYEGLFLQSALAGDLPYFLACFVALIWGGWFGMHWTATRRDKVERWSHVLLIAFLIGLIAWPGFN